MAAYNPIVRVFGRLRSALISSGVSRERVRPDVSLDEIIPSDRRREIWREFEQAGLAPPGLELSGRSRGLLIMLTLVVTPVLFAMVGDARALITIVPLAMELYAASRPWATVVPLGLRTVGDLTMFMTSFREHRDSGYRWTHNEITFRVRLCIAEAVNWDFAEIKPETTIFELVDC